MSHQVCWTKTTIEQFVQEAQLSKQEEMIIRTRAKGWTRQQQCEYLGFEMRTLDRMIDLLKKKYDKVQKYDPLLPPRKFSREEAYMDSH